MRAPAARRPPGRSSPPARNVRTARLGAIAVGFRRKSARKVPERCRTTALRVLFPPTPRPLQPPGESFRRLREGRVNGRGLVQLSGRPPTQRPPRTQQVLTPTTCAAPQVAALLGAP